MESNGCVIISLNIWDFSPSNNFFQSVLIDFAFVDSMEKDLLLNKKRLSCDRIYWLIEMPNPTCAKKYSQMKCDPQTNLRTFPLQILVAWMSFSFAKQRNQTELWNNEQAPCIQKLQNITLLLDCG